MLEKMGWKTGEGLGREGSGLKEPVSSTWQVVPLSCALQLRRISGFNCSQKPLK